MQEKIIYAIVEIFGIFAVGAALRHREILRHEDLARLSKLIFDILFPMLIFASLYRDLDPGRLYELWSLPLLGIGIMALGAIVGFGLLYGLSDRSNGRGETFLHFCAINNYQFLPLIVIGNLWGNQYIPLLFIFNLGSTLGQWTIGISLLGGGGNVKKSLRNILSPNLFAIIITLLIVCFGIRVPEVVVAVAKRGGDAALPMSLLLVGAALYSAAHHLMKGWRDMVYLVMCRLVILPLLTISILKLLPLPPDIYQVAFIVAIMPVSVTATVLTIRYGGSPEYAGQAAVVTTLASIVTMPLLMRLL